MCRLSGRALAAQARGEPGFDSVMMSPNTGMAESFEVGAHAVEHCPAHIYTQGPNILYKLTPEIIFTAGMLCSLLILHMQQLSKKPRITTAVVEEL